MDRYSLNGVSEDDGNAPIYRERQTTLTAAAIAGATTITVASSAGMVNGQAIIIGNPSPNISASEAKRITNIVGNNITFTPALFAANKANATVVNYGNRDYRNNFIERYLCHTCYCKNLSINVIG